jgi:plasmid stabilization system protein ParE
MPKKLIWSPLALTDFDNVLNYLTENWNEQVVLKFINEIEILVSNIAKEPKQFPLVNKKLRVRKCVVTKHNTLFYKESKDTIAILRIFDTRQNPNKLKFK